MEPPPPFTPYYEQTQDDANQALLHCTGEDALALRYAAEYATKFAGVDGEYYVLKDQVERQVTLDSVAPASQSIAGGAGPLHDMLYGEPAKPVVVFEDDDRDLSPAASVTDRKSQDTWQFKTPIMVSLVLTDLSDSRAVSPSGSTFERALTAAVPAANFLVMSCPPTADQATGVNLLGLATPKPGDVIWVAGWISAFFDVETVNPRGFVRPGSPPTWYDMSLIRRSKYFPERKNILPKKEDFPVQTDAGTGVD